MPIDPSIILGVRPVQIQQRDPLESYGKVLGLKAAIGQGQMQDMQMQQARRAMEDEEAVKDAYRASGGDMGTLRRLLTERGSYKQVLAMDKADLERRAIEATIRKDAATAQKTQNDIKIAAIERGAAVLSTANDQQSYDAARRNMALTFGPQSIAEMPEQFDPAFVQAKIAEGMTIAQKLADERAREGQAITVRGQDLGAATTRRGQDMTQQTAREGFGVQIRGQDVGAATARRGQDIGAETTRRGQNMQYDPQLVETRAAAQARGKEFGEAAAQGQINLPQTVATAQRAIRLIDELVGTKGRSDVPLESQRPAHPGFSGAVGATLLPGARYVHGTDAADFQARLDELQGGAFLQAFESLKGGGQITQIEGEKATAAINRMRLSQSEKEFRTAAREFQELLSAGLRRAQRKAGQTPASTGASESWTPTAPSAPAAGKDFSDLWGGR